MVLSFNYLHILNVNIYYHYYLSPGYHRNKRLIKVCSFILVVDFLITELLTFLFLIIIQENRTEQSAFSNLWSSES